MKSIVRTFASLLLLIASPAFALSLGASGETSGAVHVGDEKGITITSKTDVDVKSGAREKHEMMSASGTAEVIEKTEVETDLSPISVHASDTDSSTDETIHTSAAVQSPAQLKAFARNIVRKDTDVRDVSVSSLEVSVNHKAHARIFGIFPANVFARTQVMSDGKITVTFPWYTFASSKKAELESKVRSAVSSSLSSVALSAKLSSHAQAEILEKTITAVNADFQADTSASAK